MKIATKLQLLFLGIVAVFLVSAAAQIGQMWALSRGYDEVLATSVHDMDQARVVQLNFKKQVQEWKDTLLRGHNPDDLAKYSKQFHEKEAAVKTGAAALAKTVHDDQARAYVVQFLAADEVMSQKYQTAYEAYVAGGADFKAADKLVRGQDRAPTDLFDKAVQRLDDKVKATVAAQQASARANQMIALGLAATLLALLGTSGFLIVRSILRRLAGLKAVSDRLAVADIDGLSIDISGKDEIGEFGGAMIGVRAAIEELLHAAQTPAFAAE